MMPGAIVVTSHPRKDTVANISPVHRILGPPGLEKQSPDIARLCENSAWNFRVAIFLLLHDLLLNSLWESNSDGAICPHRAYNFKSAEQSKLLFTQPVAGWGFYFVFRVSNGHPMETSWRPTVPTSFDSYILLFQRPSCR